MNDISIVGGGIAGLWTLNRLRSSGYDAHLYEKSNFGTGQTIASQGIIHGGSKYAFDGMIRPAQETLAAMPERWRQSLRGSGEIDLRKVTYLTQHQNLQFESALVGHAASKILHGMSKKIDGTYSLNEPVLDMKTLLSALVMAGYVHHGPVPTSKLTIWTAGIGNEIAHEATQRRPLRMVMMKPAPMRLFMHLVGSSSKPKVTITTHGDVWYMGGELAETPSTLIEAKEYLKKILPTFNWDGKQWAYHDVVRAEPKNGMLLPSRPQLITTKTTCVAWPIKLAMVPVLADEILAWVKANIRPTHRSSPTGYVTPEIAKYPWETCHWETL